jgi:hypothetical protein
MKSIFPSILLIFLFQSTTSQTLEKTGWIVKERSISLEFIRAYQDSLEKDGKEGSDDPKFSDELIVQVEFTRDNGVQLTELKSRNQFGVYKSFRKDILDKQSPITIRKLTERKYPWQELNASDLTSLSYKHAVQNVYDVRNYKKARDAFWWTFREFDLSSDFRFVIRPGTYAIFTEQGLMNSGYSHLSSRTLSFGIANEIAKVFTIIPWVLPYEIALQGRPLDGFWGFGLAFDSQFLGAEFTYQDPTIGVESFKPFDENNDFIFSNITASVYYSNTFNFDALTKSVSSLNKFGQSRKQIFPAGSFRIKAGLSYRQLTYGKIENDTVSTMYKTDLLESSRLMAKAEYISDDDVYRVFSQFHLGQQMSIQLGIDRRFLSEMFKYLKLGFRFNYSTKVILADNGTDIFTWEPGFMFIPAVTFIF